MRPDAASYMLLVPILIAYCIFTALVFNLSLVYRYFRDVTNLCSWYSVDNVTMLWLTYWERRSTCFDGILDASGNIRDEMTLEAKRTKRKRARKVFLSKQMNVNYDKLQALLAPKSKALSNRC
jgi:hypothetical protein